MELVFLLKYWTAIIQKLRWSNEYISDIKRFSSPVSTLQIFCLAAGFCVRCYWRSCAASCRSCTQKYAKNHVLQNDENFIMMAFRMAAFWKLNCFERCMLRRLGAAASEEKQNGVVLFQTRGSDLCFTDSLNFFIRNFTVGLLRFLSVYQFYRALYRLWSGMGSAHLERARSCCKYYRMSYPGTSKKENFICNKKMFFARVFLML